MIIFLFRHVLLAVLPRSNIFNKGIGRFFSHKGNCSAKVRVWADSGLLFAFFEECFFQITFTKN